MVGEEDTLFEEFDKFNREINKKDKEPSLEAFLDDIKRYQEEFGKFL